MCKEATLGALSFYAMLEVRVANIQRNAVEARIANTFTTEGGVAVENESD